MPAQTLSFDQNGYLKPYEIIETDLETLEEYLVHAFPNSQTRRWLFNNYLKYLNRFEREVFPHYEQWLGGSFTTLKQNPNDMDFVIFLDHQVYEMKGDTVMDRFWTFSWEREGLDAYIVKEYPPEHSLHDEMLGYKNSWLNRYSWTRPDNYDRKYPKGFLKIIFKKQ